MAQVGRRDGAKRLGLVLDRRLAVALCVVVAALAVAGVVASGVVGTRALTLERGSAATTVVRAAASDAAATTAETTPAPVVVHVDGAVASPGVVTLVAGSRVADAVAAAGGVTEGANTTGVNLAAPVTDGQQVVVPEVGEPVPVAADTTGAAAAPQSGGLVNINTAGPDALDALPGVGESTARAIVEEREANGPFSSVEDLVRVSGIGEKKLAKIIGHACV